MNPSVSLVMPCRNEVGHIEACLDSILCQDWPTEDLEILVVDGMSTDGTRAILRQMAEQDGRIRLLDNPSGTTPCGFNIGIQAARGRFIGILGAHTVYAPDFVKTCMALLDEHPEACCTGGPIVSRGRSLFGRAVAAAMSHPVGVGNARHRFPDYEGYAEGACFPLFRREVFDKVGLYDESLVRNQDDELNFRLALIGERIFISPRARCTYFVRETPARVFGQYFHYGFWRVAVLRKHRRPASIRQLVPVLFGLPSVVLLVVGAFLPNRWALVAVFLPITYGFLLLGAAAGMVVTRGWAVGLLFPVAAFLTHSAYAVGFCWGLVRGKAVSAAPSPYSETGSSCTTHLTSG